MTGGACGGQRPASRVGILRPSKAGKTGQKKRLRSDQEKGLICAQALAAGVSVAQVARRCAMKGNMVFRWVKDPRFSPATGKAPDAPRGGGVFLPVQISGFAIDQRVDDTAVRTAGSVSALLRAHRVSGTLAQARYLRHPGFLLRPLVRSPRPPGRPAQLTPAHRNVRPSGIARPCGGFRRTCRQECRSMLGHIRVLRFARGIAIFPAARSRSFAEGPT